MAKWLLIAALAVLLLTATGVPVVAAARDLVTRGDVLSSTELNDDGDIPDDPNGLASDAGETVDDYAGMRMLRSEAGHHGPMSKLQRAHAALNDARNHFGGSVYKCVTASSRGQTGFGSQSGRRYSTALDPYENDRQIWHQALDERAQGIDRVQGAEKFVNISGMGGVQAGTPTYASLLASWTSQGFAPVDLADDNDEPDLVFFAKGGS